MNPKITKAVALLEVWDAGHYVEPRRVPCVVLGRVRHRSESVRGAPNRISWGIVRIHVEDEDEPRDVSACRVEVDGQSLWSGR